MRRMFDWYDHRGLLGNPLVLRAILGREPRTLEQYIRELAPLSDRRDAVCGDEIQNGFEASVEVVLRDQVFQRDVVG